MIKKQYKLLKKTIYAHYLHTFNDFIQTQKLTKQMEYTLIASNETIRVY